MQSKIVYTTLMLLVLIGAWSCEKEETTIPPALAEFTQTGASYFIRNDPNSVFKIPVGITNVSDRDRTVQFTVSSPTGAAAGTQYTLASSSLVIPAGKAVDSITLKGLFSGYPANRRDTLVFTITGGDVSPADWGKTYNLVLQKYCDVDLNSFLGVYTQSFDGSSGPYTITVKSATATGPTTGYLMVENLWETGDPALIRVNLDWTDPANFTTSIPTGQFLYTDSRYGAARVRPVGTGTFSSCENKLTLKYQVYVDAGNFSATTTTMSR